MPEPLIPTTTLLTPDLRVKVAESAKRNHRTVSSEIAHILAQKFNDETDLRKEAAA